jgi:hypothetical protein
VTPITIGSVSDTRATDRLLEFIGDQTNDPKILVDGRHEALVDPPTVVRHSPPP